MKIRGPQIQQPISGTFSGSFIGDGSQLTGINFILTSGSGTTPSGSAVNLGGILNSNANIILNGNSFLIRSESYQNFGVSEQEIYSLVFLSSSLYTETVQDGYSYIFSTQNMGHHGDIQLENFGTSSHNIAFLEVSDWITYDSLVQVEGSGIKLKTKNSSTGSYKGIYVNLLGEVFFDVVNNNSENRLLTWNSGSGIIGNRDIFSLGLLLTSSFNNYTSSVKLDSASFDSRINLKTDQTVFVAFSQSIHNYTASNNLNSASFESTIRFISGSYVAFTQSYYNDSASFDARINAFSGGGISAGIFNPFSQSIHNWSSSINLFTASVIRDSASFDSRINNKLDISEFRPYSQSINLWTSSINQWSASLSSSGYWIQNQNELKQTASFHISGSGIVSGNLYLPLIPNDQLLNQFVVVDTGSGKFSYRSGSLGGGSTIDTSIFVLTSSFNSFTQSIHNYTASAKLDSASFDSRINSISSNQSNYTLLTEFRPYSQSINNFTASVVRDSASFDSRINLKTDQTVFVAFSQSIHIFTASVIRDSASFDSRINTINNSLGNYTLLTEFRPYSQSINLYTASAKLDSASFDARINLKTDQTVFTTYSQSINTWTSSINIWSASLSSSGYWIQNQFSSAQPSSNFWLSGNGKVNGYFTIGGPQSSSHAFTQYGSVVLAAGASPLYPTVIVGEVGVGAGSAGISIKTGADDYAAINGDSGLNLFGSNIYRSISLWAYAGGTLLHKSEDLGGNLNHAFYGRIFANSTNTAGTNLGVYNIDRTFSEISSGPGQHGYVDKTIYRYGAGAFNAFYAENTIGTVTASYTQDHWAGFQTLIIKDGNNNVINLYDFVALGSLIQGGSVTNRKVFSVFDAVPSGTGSLVNQYVLYVPSLIGATNNWTIYSIDAPSYHGGKFLLGSITDLGNYKLQVTGNTTISGSLYIKNTKYENNETGSISGSNTIIATLTSSYNAIFYNYLLTSASNLRAGQIIAVWSASNVQFNEVVTNDIGNTSTASFSVDISASYVRLVGDIPQSSWNVKTNYSML